MRSVVLVVALVSTACIYSKEELVDCVEQGLDDCDGIDNDCDGDIDEDCSPCVEQGLDGCDGIDNDCDEQIDEDCCDTNGEARSCGSDVGRCELGTQTCVENLWSDCADEVPPEPEPCTDEIDHDCDGLAGCLDLDCWNESVCAARSCTANAGPVSCVNPFSNPLDTSTTANTMSWYSCLPWDQTGNELIYTFAVDEPADVEISIWQQDPGVDTDIVVLSGGCTPDACLTHGDRSVEFAAVPGTSYFIVFDGYEGRNGILNASIQCYYQPEICANGIDDDGDGDVDCADDECTTDPDCTTPACSQTSMSTLYCNIPASPALYVTSSDVLDDYSTCNPTGITGLTGPEQVWSLHAEETGTVELAFESEGGNPPHVMVLEAGCVTSECILHADASSVAPSFPVTVGTTYYIIVDGSDGERSYSLRAVCPWESCSNNRDDDNDGLVDAADWLDCGTGVEVCANGHDDDGDGSADCDDTDCDADPACDGCRPGYLYCGDTRLADSSSHSFSASDVLDTYSGSCSDDAAMPERTYELLAPNDGNVTVTATAYDGLGAGIFVMEGECEGTACIASGSNTVTWAATAGTTYTIAIDNATRTLTYDLEVECAFEPCNETFRAGEDGPSDPCAPASCEGTPFCPSGVCDMAYAESIECDTPVSGDTTGAPNNMAHYLPCGYDNSNIGGERIYQFSATEDGVVSVNVTADSEAAAATFLLDGECDARSCVQGRYVNNFSVHGGRDYFLVVDATDAEYTITLTCGVAPSYETECANGIDDDGDGLRDCADEQDCTYRCNPGVCGGSVTGGQGPHQPLGCGDWVVGATTAGGPGSTEGVPVTDNIDQYGCDVGWGALGPEVAYQVIFDSAAPVHIDFAPHAHMKWYILEGECRPERCVAAYGGGPFVPVAGRLYYLVVDGVEDDASGTFELGIRCD